jgi:hypothetical protein
VTDENFADRYSAAMDRAHETYRDVLEALWSAEIPAFMTQTGGMCLAIQIPWRKADWFWLTDKGDSLSWDRQETDGWALGFYLDEDDYGEGVWAGDLLTRDLKSPETAVELVLEGIRKAQTEDPR